MIPLSRFKHLINDHYSKHGRSFPWRETTNPYHIVVSEVMLQQTQADRVVDFYTRFIKKFPTFAALAKAELSELLPAWKGLGYNRRALFLKKLAEVVSKNYKGRLPTNPADIDALPGIGPATAASIAAFAFNSPTVFIETNIRSVYLHHFFAGQDNVSDEDLLPLIEKTLDRDNPRRWYNALMDYGTLLKKQGPNPSRRSRHHQIQSKFAGSDRQIRGKILAILGVKNVLNAVRLAKLAEHLETDQDRVSRIAKQLEKEGFLKASGTGWHLV